MKRSEAVDTWMRLEKHPNPTHALDLIAGAAAHVKQSEDGGFDAFMERLKADVDADPDAPKSNVKFDKLNDCGLKIEDAWELVHAWNERGNPERPCMRVRLLRQNEQTGKKKHAGYFEPIRELLETEHIFALLGGGTYRVELLDAEGKYCTSTEMCISDSFQ